MSAHRNTKSPDPPSDRRRWPIHWDDEDDGGVGLDRSTWDRERPWTQRPVDDDNDTRRFASRERDRRGN